MWDAIFYDETSQRALRIKARALTVRDGIRLDEAQIALANSDLGSAEHLARRRCLLMEYGTALAEYADLAAEPSFGEDGVPLVPEDVEWKPLAVSQDVLLDLDEIASFVWFSRVIARNPHRDDFYDVLKKSMVRGVSTDENAESTTPNEQPGRSSS